MISINSWCLPSVIEFLDQFMLLSCQTVNQQFIVIDDTVNWKDTN